MSAESNKTPAKVALPLTTEKPAVKPVEKPAPQPVTCADYRAFLARPESVTDCELRIAIIRHAASCAACLDLVFEKLAQVDDARVPAPAVPVCRRKD